MALPASTAKLELVPEVARLPVAIGADVIARAAGGDSAARELIYRAHAPSIANVAARALRSRAAAQDLVQDTFVAAFEGLHRVKDPTALRGWLTQIAVHLMRRRWRRERVLTFVGFTREPAQALDTWLPEGSSSDIRLLLRDVDHVLSTLPEKVRLAWLLRNVEDEKLEDIAGVLGCSLATVKRWIAQADATLAVWRSEGARS